jgi:hypothetical protein
MSDRDRIIEMLSCYPKISGKELEEFFPESVPVVK